MKQLTMGSKIRLATYVPGPPDGQECLVVVVECHGAEAEGTTGTTYAIGLCITFLLVKVRFLTLVTFVKLL